MLPDFLTNLLASLTSDLLRALLPRPPRQDEIAQLAAQVNDLRALLARFGAPQVVRIEGDVVHSLIVLGDGNTVTVADSGSLAQRWAAWQASPAEARAFYLSRLAALRQLHTFPLSGLSFALPLEKIYQRPGLVRSAGEGQPAPSPQAPPLGFQELLGRPRPLALTGILGQGKTTTLRYLTWAYAAHPESLLLPGLGERLPFPVGARRLAQVWSAAPDPLAAWAQALCGESPALHPALVRRVLQDALSEGRALLLVDALDEARLSDPARADFLANLRLLGQSEWRGNLLLVTSRPYAWLQSGFETFALRDLEPPDVQRLAYRLGQALLEKRRADGLPADSPAALLERLTRLTDLPRLRPLLRTVTPFYVTLLTLLALREPDLEIGLSLAAGVRRLAELYLFFLRQTLRWEEGKRSDDERLPPEERAAFLALAEAAWRAFGDSLPDPGLRARLETPLLPEAERAPALTFWLRSGLLGRDEFSGQLEFAHSGFAAFGAALYLHQAWQQPARRAPITDLQKRTAALAEWSDVWEIFYGLDAVSL